MAEIWHLLEQAESAFSACLWTEAEDALERLLDLEPGHPKAKEMLKEIRQNSARLMWLKKAADEAEGAGDLEKTVALLEEIVPLSENRERTEAKKNRLEQDILNKRQEAEKKKRPEEEPVLHNEPKQQTPLEGKRSALKKVHRPTGGTEKPGPDDKPHATPASKDQNATRQQTTSAPKTGFTNSVTSMKFVYVPAGSFMMGDVFGSGKEEEQPVHEVELEAFYMGKHPVTQSQWQRVMGSNPSHFNERKDFPVDSVSWEDIQEFIKRLTAMNREKYRFRLPTEAEWEYACRSGGKKERYSGGDDLGAVAWVGKNSGKSTQPVGQKKPNGLGIHDMNGNVWEWCEDWFGHYPSAPEINPKGPSSGSKRALRGGCWNDGPDNCRSARRLGRKPGHRQWYYGFRLACEAVGDSS